MSVCEVRYLHYLNVLVFSLRRRKRNGLK